MLIQLTYLTWVHSKGQGQGYAHFDCKYVINGGWC